MVRRCPPQPIADLVGHAAAMGIIEDAYANDRCPHALMLKGPEGIGKARAALQLAEHFLGTRDAVRSASHPDFRWIGADNDEAGDIPVDAIRDLVRFFAHRASEGGYRVAVIDPIDRLNRFGLNALLKTLEEPPGDCGLLVLVCHGQRLVPPTIASRCMQIAMRPLSAAETRQVLVEAGADPERVADAERHAAGRPGTILRVLGPVARAAALAAQDAIAKRGAVGAETLAELVALTGRSEEAFEAAGSKLCEHAVRSAKLSETSELAGAWACAALHMTRIASEKREFKLDGGQSIAAMLDVLRGVAGTANDARAHEPV